MLGQERRVNLGRGTKDHMHAPLLGHAGAMLVSDLHLLYILALFC